MEIEGLSPNGPGGKLKVFSMSDGTGDVYRSNYLLVAQYRGLDGNPNNAIAYKALLGDPWFKLEPDFPQRAAAVMALDPARAYFWKGTWGNFFRLVVQFLVLTHRHAINLVSALAVKSTMGTTRA